MSSSSFARAALGCAFVTFVGFGSGCASSSRSTPAVMSSGSLNSAPAQPAALSVPGVQRTQTAADGLHAMSQELSGARQTVGETLTALQELSNAQGDLLAPFERYMRLKENVDQSAQRIGQRGEEMRGRARDYITNWEVEVYGVEDAGLRAQAEQRRNRVRADYGKISDASRSLRESIEPFQRQLGDIQTFLSNDLTPAGVRAASNSIQKATQSGQELQRRIDSLIAEVDRVASSMTPAVPEPASIGGTTANSARPAVPGASSTGTWENK